MSERSMVDDKTVLAKAMETLSIAVDRVKALEAENERLRALCKEASDHWVEWLDDNHDGDGEFSCNCNLGDQLYEAGYGQKREAGK